MRTKSFFVEICYCNYQSRLEKVYTYAILWLYIKFQISIEEPGELVVYANELKNFNCIVENGNPRPSGIKWAIDDSVIEIPIRIKHTFNGKVLECSVTQKDSKVMHEKLKRFKILFGKFKNM